MKLSCCAVAPCTTAASTACSWYRMHAPSCHTPPMSTARNTSHSSLSAAASLTYATIFCSYTNVILSLWKTKAFDVFLPIFLNISCECYV